jgi:hypothetical protein
MLIIRERMSSLANWVVVAWMAQYLSDFAAWAYTAPTVVGFLWAGFNNVGTTGSELSLNGKLQPCGQAFKTIQQNYPPISE